MRRRKFLQSSVAVAGVGTLASVLTGSTQEKNAGTGPEYYELRLYHLQKGPKQKLFADFYRNASIPAMGRAGLGPVGVFSALTDADNDAMYVLIPHKSPESFATAGDRFRADPEYQKTGAEFINAPASDPAYLRMESSLMVAFAGMPKLMAPVAVAVQKPRIFELRTYESHSKSANKKKIEMFNTGELALFRRAGLRPVFFGETLIGTRLPNLTYMLTYDDMAEHDKCWRTFTADPEWKKLSTTPGYRDAEIVSKITNIFLKPADFSQI
jgi:hypothetical protein